MNRIYPTLAIASLLLTAGCNANGEPATNDASAILSDGTQRALEAAEVSIATKAAGILAEELDIPVSEVMVISVRPVEWPDSSIGCPQPGQAYMQVITPGHKISLRARDQVYVMHEAGGKPFLCKRTKAVTELTPQRELAWAEMAVEAREDLAGQLGVSPDDVKLTQAKRKRFEDASLGCPEPGVDYPAVAVDGYVLMLRHDSRSFTYHTDLERVIACPAITAD